MLADFSPKEEYQRVMNTNWLGHVMMTKAHLDAVRRGRGRIVMMTSVAGLLASAHMSAYSSSKYALEAFADSLRREMSRWRVTVSIIEPFFYKTQIMAEVPHKFQAAWQALPTWKQELYGGDAYCASVAHKNDRITQIMGDPEVVVADFVHAITHPAPHVRYHPGFMSKLTWIMAALPAQWTDAIIRCLDRDRDLE
jgi:NAD(P)-dependent dehydrogenase (short-subunit alcohol dehydrogenase family)